jgi:hypothetical protein
MLAVWPFAAVTGYFSTFAVWFFAVLEKVSRFHFPHGKSLRSVVLCFEY